MNRTGRLLVTGFVVMGILAGFKKLDKRSEKAVTSIAQTETVSLTVEEQNEQLCMSRYNALRLEEAGLSKQAFRYAWNGFQKAGFSKPILAIADFSQSSRKKRLYVIDFENNQILLNTYVAHGRNSGDEYAKRFSNTNSSYQSSLGFYRALNTYQGKHGLSMRLQGLEKNINDQALARAIVMHGADYVSERFINQTGRLGRSLGCPAVSQADHESLITLLQDGAGLFLYSPDATYLSSSEMIQGVETPASVSHRTPATRGPVLSKS